MSKVVKAVVNIAIIAVAVYTGNWQLAFQRATMLYAGMRTLTAISKALAPKPKSGQSRGMEVAITDTTAPVRVIYGEVRVSGVNMLPPYTSGTSGRYLHQVLALAAHEIDSFIEYYFDADTITSGSVTAVTGTANDGKVTSGKYVNAAWIRGYRGTMTQTVDYILNAAFPTEWASTARGRGIAYLALQYDWGDGKLYQSYPQVTVRLRGAKVYDPRLDSTNGGSGTQRYTDSTTWTYSNNPALCWANYKIASYGFGCDPATEVDWASVTAAANVCDALVSIPGATTQKRYTCNGVLVNTINSLRENEETILDSMLGNMVYVNGKWSCYAGTWNSPPAENIISKEDWLSIDSLQTVSPRDEGRFNEVHCFFVDPTRNWQRVECYVRKNSTYKDDDAGEWIPLEIEQPMCTSEYEAQRKAEFVLRQSRNAVKLVGTLPPRFHYLKTFETVALTFEELGWSSKTFRIGSMTLNPNGSVRVGLQEEQSADWTDLASGDYGTQSTATIPTTNPTSPSEATLSVSNVLNGTIRFTLATPAVRPTNTRYQLIQGTTSNNAATGTVIYDGEAQVLDLPTPSSAYYYWSRAYAGSYYGPYSPNTTGLTAAANTVTAPPTSGSVGATEVKSGSIGAVKLMPNSGVNYSVITAGELNTQLTVLDSTETIIYIGDAAGYGRAPTASMAANSQIITFKVTGQTKSISDGLLYDTYQAGIGLQYSTNVGSTWTSTGAGGSVTGSNLTYSNFEIIYSTFGGLTAPASGNVLWRVSVSNQLAGQYDYSGFYIDETTLTVQAIFNK